MIRGLMLTDALAYIAFRNKAPVNDAIANPSGVTHRLGLNYLLGHAALPDTKRLSWICIDRGQITGLVSVRNRLAADIWDIDQLVAISGADQPRTYAELLNHLVSSAYSEGVQRIFLRVQADSEAEYASRQVGFCRYTTESVYLLDHNLSPAPPRSLRFRPRRPVDHQALFQLYCAAVPARVRQIEGMTLQEWRSTDGWGLYPMNWRVGLPYGRRDFLVEDERVLVAWLQVEPRSRVLRLLLRPSWQVDVGTIVALGARQTHKCGQTLIPVRDYQESVRVYLEENEFKLVAQHALLSRSLAVRVLEPRLVPLRARGAP